MYRGCNDSLPLLRNRRTDFLFFFFFSTLPTYNVPALPLPRQVDNNATLAFLASDDRRRKVIGNGSWNKGERRKFKFYDDR